MSDTMLICLIIIAICTVAIAVTTVISGMSTKNLEKYREQYEEVKVRNALHTLKEYCDNHVDCKECYIAERKYPYETCPCATLVNEVYEHDPGWWKYDK